jgi:hypothetical protein
VLHQLEQTKSNQVGYARSSPAGFAYSKRQVEIYSSTKGKAIACFALALTGWPQNNEMVA